MQTIPDRVLDAVGAAKPWTQHMIDRLRADPDNILAPTWETWIAQQTGVGNFPAGLGGMDMWHLSACYYGHPWSGDWVRLSEAAELTGYDHGTLRRMLNDNKLSGIKHGKTWYVRRDALPTKP